MFGVMSCVLGSCGSVKFLQAFGHLWAYSNFAWFDKTH